jgi:hypothetical protein
LLDHHGFLPAPGILADATSGQGGSIVVILVRRCDHLRGAPVGDRPRSAGLAEFPATGSAASTGPSTCAEPTAPPAPCLLDPADVVITDGTVATGQSAISPEVIEAQLADTNFVVTTNGGSGTGAASSPRR